jgi:hypothetical protein
LELSTLGIVKLLYRLSHQTDTEGTSMDRDELAVTVLLEIDRRHAEALARPRPPKWRKWDVVADHGDREFGPLYSPQWFGDLTAAEAGRQRVLRTVRRLAEAGLVDVFRSRAGRLERVLLTDAGRDVIADAPADHGDGRTHNGACPPVPRSVE